VYGPEELGVKSHVISDFIEQAKTQKCIKMLTDGTEVRQFLHCDDFARAIGYIVNNFEQCKNEYGSVIDVSNFEWVTILEVAHIVAHVYGPGVSVIPGTLLATFQTKQNEPRPDFSKSGWIPYIPLVEGVRMLSTTTDN